MDQAAAHAPSPATSSAAGELEASKNALTVVRQRLRDLTDAVEEKRLHRAATAPLQGQHAHRSVRAASRARSVAQRRDEVGQVEARARPASGGYAYLAAETCSLNCQTRTRKLPYGLAGVPRGRGTILQIATSLAPRRSRQGLMHPRIVHAPAATIVAAVPLAVFLFNPSSALAQCTPAAPVSGQTVNCSGNPRSLHLGAQHAYRQRPAQHKLQRTVLGVDHEPDRRHRHQQQFSVGDVQCHRGRKLHHVRRQHKQRPQLHQRRHDHYQQRETSTSSSPSPMATS